MVLLTPVTPLYNWGWFYLFALCVAFLVHAQRQFSMGAIAGREAMLTRRDGALQNLVSAPELFKEDVSNLFQHVCRIATQQLNIDRAGIWLTSPDKQSLRRVMMWELQQPNRDEVLILREDIPDFFERAITSPSVSLENVGDESILNQTLRNAGVELDGRGLLICSIMVGGQVKGVLVGVDSLPRIWSIEDRAFG